MTARHLYPLRIHPAVVRLEERRDHWCGAATLARIERDRLARILAVERGDQTQAPPGWTWTGREWSRSNACVGRGQTQWRLAIRSPETDRWGDGVWYDSALEAMEAVDAADGVGDG